MLVRYCQIDSCRMAGVSEVLSVLLMSAKAGVKVCPHAGGVGLCEYVRHLAMIDFVCFNPTDEFDRVCESISGDSLLHHFEDPVSFNSIAGDGLFYKAPAIPGYARMHESSRAEFEYPSGSAWLEDPAAKEVARKQPAARDQLPQTQLAAGAAGSDPSSCCPHLRGSAAKANASEGGSCPFAHTVGGSAWRCPPVAFAAGVLVAIAAARLFKN